MSAGSAQGLRTTIYRFGEFELDARNGELRRLGHPLRIQQQPYRVLTILVQCAGELVTREEFRQQLWPGDVLVDFDHALSKSINKLRELLGDSAANPKFIETKSRLGYRFIAAVEVKSAAVAAETGIPVDQTGDGSPPIGQASESVVPGAWPRQSRTRIVNLGVGVAAGIAVLVSILLGISWFRGSGTVHVREHQLTGNPSSLPVMSAAISPDGKLLAYADPTGLFVREMESGEVHHLQIEDEPHPNHVTWFPDSLTLLIGGESGAWKISVFGGGARRIGDSAPWFAVSPDASKISYLRERDGVWIMGPNGEDPHKVMGFSQAAETISPVSWSPDSSHFTYARHWQTPGVVLGAIEVRKADGSSPETVAKNGGQAPCWISEDTILYSRAEPYPSKRINLWEVHVDSTAGKATSSPQQATDWPEFSFRSITATRDGRYVSFVRMRWRTDIYMMDVVGDRLSVPYRFTFDERNSWPATWSRDGQIMYFVSDRRGTAGIFRQRLGSKIAQVVYARPDKDLENPTLTADGQWLLYSSDNSAPENRVQYLRVALNGGAAQSVIDAQPGSAIQCPTSAQAPCVLEEFGVFTAFDPVAGRGKVVGRVPLNTPDVIFWSLSPDGSRIAFVHPEFRGILELTTGVVRQLHFDHGYAPENLRWSADGKRLIGVQNPSDRGGEALIFSADPDGRTHVLARLAGEIIGDLTLSPDGQHLAFTSVTEDNNVWMIDRQPRRSLRAALDAR